MASDPKYYVLCARKDFTAAEVANALDGSRFKARAAGDKNVIIHDGTYEFELVFEHAAFHLEIIDSLEREIAAHPHAERIKAAERGLIFYWNREDWEEVWSSVTDAEIMLGRSFGPIWTYDPIGLRWMWNEEQLARLHSPKKKAAKKAVAKKKVKRAPAKKKAPKKKKPKGKK